MKGYTDRSSVFWQTLHQKVPFSSSNKYPGKTDSSYERILLQMSYPKVKQDFTELCYTLMSRAP